MISRAARAGPSHRSQMVHRAGRLRQDVQERGARMLGDDPRGHAEPLSEAHEDRGPPILLEQIDSSMRGLWREPMRDSCEALSSVRAR